MKKFINIILNGYIGLIFPLVVCIILVEKLLHIIDPLIQLIEVKLHVTRVLGILGIFVISILLLLLLGYLAGLLIKSPWVKKEIKGLENGFLSKVPVYNTIKALISNEVEDSADSNKFRPALIKDGDFYCLGYVTSKSNNYYTVNICESASRGGEIRIVSKDLVKFIDISFIDFAKKVKQYGIDSAQFAEYL